MSETVAELVNREAAQAERDDDETTEPAAPNLPPEPDEPPEDPAPSGPPSEAAIERALKQIDKAGDAYVKKIDGIQTVAQLGLVECPLCPIPGFVSEMPPPEHDPAQVEAITNYLGLTGPPSYVQSPNHTTCTACDGLGALATGSRRDGFRDVQCEECMGNGYIDLRHRAEMNGLHSPTGHLVTLPAYAAPAAVPEPMAPGLVSQGGYQFTLSPGGASDPVGRIAGHPLWGMPAEAGGF
jgi:hypothetical protein